MSGLSRRHFLAAVAATLPAARIGAQAAVPSLKNTCKGLFLIGTAFD